MANLNLICIIALSHPSALCCAVMKLFRFGLMAVGLLRVPLGLLQADPQPDASWRQRIQADWLAQEEILSTSAQPGALTTAQDAAGGCDGIKDGRWGFHTGPAPTPWWQVDLGQVQPLGKVVIWNRCDAASATERALHLRLCLSQDGNTWRTVYTHDGSAFLGFPDQKPLGIALTNQAARWVRVETPGGQYLHLDEVEVFGPDPADLNLALHRPADQISVSQWSTAPRRVAVIQWGERLQAVLHLSQRLIDERRQAGLDMAELSRRTEALAERVRALPIETVDQSLFWEGRWILRELTLSNPLLNFQTMLVTKRVPGTFNHMSDQYYGWWSRPGGGIYLLRDFTGPKPSEVCLTESFREPGNFLSPNLSYDGSKVLFAWCRHYPGLAQEPNKLDKRNVPEDAFYHLYEMNLDGTGLRRLTHGRYDNFSGSYLPDGRIVFLSTRRGQSIQVGSASAARSLQQPDLPDCYVRCGGDASRPVAVYTLHVMNADGSGLIAISPFEMFEWEPSVAHDGTILYSRWDYVDRDNMPFMSLWSIHPDGTHSRLVYGNYTRNIHGTFEPRCIPGSHKVVFTASAHHAHTMGSLVLLDPSAGQEGGGPITRLTPEVAFPEAEAWPLSSYANPWPLSERCYLVAWGNEGVHHPGPSGWDRWHAVLRPPNGMGIFFFDAAGILEPLYRDPDITCMYPMPVQPRPRPPVVAGAADWTAPQEGFFLLENAQHGLESLPPHTIRSLRIVAIPAKTQPWMNEPVMGITRDDPGKCVLGTVPVEADGSAHFRVPSGVTVFFQALDQDGFALQTMRSATHVQPGQTLGCVGCHEHRGSAPPGRPLLAATRPPAKITPGPAGSWPVDFDHLVQPVLNGHCVSCHQPESPERTAAPTDLRPGQAYDTLVRYGAPSLADQVLAAYRQGASQPGQSLARQSALLRAIDNPSLHPDLRLDEPSRQRLILWMDTYAQRVGYFSPEQQQDLERLRVACAPLLSQNRQPAP